MASPTAGFLTPVTEALGSLGFKRCRGRYMRRIDDDIWEQVDFDAALKFPDRFLLTPDIEIAHRGAMDIYIRAYPDIYGAYEGLPDPPIVREVFRHILPRTPKAGTPRGCLQEQGYWVPRNHCPPAVVDQFMAEFKEYGIPWLARFHTEADIEKALQAPDWEGPTGWEVKLPALLASQGRLKECWRMLDECLARSVREKDGAPWYRQYSENLKRLTAGPEQHEETAPRRNREGRRRRASGRTLDP